MESRRTKKQASTNETKTVSKDFVARPVHIRTRTHRVTYASYLHVDAGYMCFFYILLPSASTSHRHKAVSFQSLITHNLTTAPSVVLPCPAPPAALSSLRRTCRERNMYFLACMVHRTTFPPVT